ncbi:phenylacetic acid degradation protein PaaN [Allorhizocola rhizosphaerae]|uniref:phenylacetic acid degradation protein PaaN n=1 Tax=Allorhizocola rhizosphaerae TaxID=1872709 RepID=UPI000E3B7C21|nr:phenylacetic acid degradation protein PaaN [Allorhizocola rhizosphaerae]
MDFFSTHEELLTTALRAISERSYWSAYSESPSPKVYGETAVPEGRAAFQALLGKDFPLDQPAAQRVAPEKSPLGIALGVSYPQTPVDTLIAHARQALPGWRDAGPQGRAGVCLEILARLHKRVFELANAVHATTGQPFVMAFQAGGPHALDRALEAIAYGYAEQTRQVGSVTWVKKADSLDKTYHLAPRGIGLVIGCNTFPTWNSWPGMFASLITGNPVIVKPHPRAVLPLAISVQVAREVLAEAGLDPNTVQLAVDTVDAPVTKELALRPEVKLIDFTGSTAFGDWLEQNARQAQVYTEKAGVNTVVIDSTDNLDGMARNLAFSLILYSGQMCTTPQNLLIPAQGIQTDQGHKNFDDVVRAIGAAVSSMLADPAKAVELTGAIVNDEIPGRIDRARGMGEVMLDSAPIAHPSYPDAVVRTPLIVKATDGYASECFGPVSFAVPTESTQDSVRIFRETIGEKGALTAAVYSTSDAVLEEMEKAAVDVGVHLSENLTGGVFVNQSAAFSDFHASGANPAANATLTDGAFVASRFRIVQSRRPTPA